MTMAKELHSANNKQAFWLALPDQTQGAVHLALQWLAYVYPASELQIDKTLSSALPYADSDLTSRWIQFLDDAEVNEHVDALQWMAKTLSREQIPFLVETCWRLLLVDHEFPNHVPLALRLMGQILNIEEQRLHDIGEAVFQEYTDTIEDKLRAPLLPIDPRYLDRVEWRLYGQSRGSRSTQSSTSRDNSSLKIAVSGFVVGSIFGASVLGFLVFGPWDIGRFQSASPSFALTPAPSIPQPIDEPDPIVPTINANTVVAPPAVEVQAESEPAGTVVSQFGLAETQPAEVAPEVSSPASTAEQEAVESVNISPVQAAPEAAIENPVTESARQLMEITASILNVRAQPTVDSTIVIKLGEGAKVWAYPDESIGMWMKISVEGQIGYASSRFMRAID